MSELIDKYMMLTSESITQTARTISHGSIQISTGYDTSYSKVGSRISSRWLDERLAIL